MDSNIIVQQKQMQVLAVDVNPFLALGYEIMDSVAFKLFLVPYIVATATVPALALWIG